MARRTGCIRRVRPGGFHPHDVVLPLQVDQVPRDEKTPDASCVARPRARGRRLRRRRSWSGASHAAEDDPIVRGSACRSQRQPQARGDLPRRCARDRSGGASSSLGGREERFRPRRRQSHDRGCPGLLRGGWARDDPGPPHPGSPGHGSPRAGAQFHSRRLPHRSPDPGAAGRPHALDRRRRPRRSRTARRHRIRRRAPGASRRSRRGPLPCHVPARSSTGPRRRPVP